MRCTTDEAHGMCAPGGGCQRRRNRARGSLYLIKDLNCPVATLEAVQDIAGKKNPTLLRAMAGLEGGVIASGSTCGAVTGGALGLAMLNDAAVLRHGLSAQKELLQQVGAYVRWFADTYKTTDCRQRTGVDFYTASGQVRYLVPGDLMLRCVSHLGGGVDYVTALPAVTVKRPGGAGAGASTADSVSERLHCAPAALGRVAADTGVGDSYLSRLSVVFDGGVGLTGNVCGALLGAVMSLGLKFGENLEESHYPKVLKTFFIGHLNLLVEKPKGMPELFAIGKELVEGFRGRFGNLTCGGITGTAFHDYDDFASYRRDGRCSEVIEFCTSNASRLLKKWG